MLLAIYLILWKMHRMTYNCGEKMISITDKFVKHTNATPIFQLSSVHQFKMVSPEPRSRPELHDVTVTLFIFTDVLASDSKVWSIEIFCNLQKDSQNQSVHFKGHMYRLWELLTLSDRRTKRQTVTRVWNVKERQLCFQLHLPWSSTKKGIECAALDQTNEHWIYL